MAETEIEKTHVLLQDCIIGELGRCEAGHMISKSDVHSSTWNWLNQQGFLKSVTDIEAEADSEPVETEAPKPVKPKAQKSVKTEAPKLMETETKEPVAAG